tara:strand:- start:206 stop:352 length:147 start_codon:yes stop_codon:yes gene_type:complete
MAYYSNKLIRLHLHLQLWSHYMDLILLHHQPSIFQQKLGYQKLQDYLD